MRSQMRAPVPRNNKKTDCRNRGSSRQTRKTMKKFFSGLALLAAVLLLASCQDDLFDWGHKLKLSENEIAFRVGKTNTTATRADVQRTVVAPTNVYDLPVTDDGQQFCLIETVTSLE